MITYHYFPLHAENFMTGQRIIFDREKFVLGWEIFNCKCCYAKRTTILHVLLAKLWFALSYFWNYYILLSGYDIDDSSTLPVNRRNTTSAVPPSEAIVPSSYNPEATKQTGNESQVSVLPVPPVISRSSYCCSCFVYTHLMLFLLLSAILWSFFWYRNI